MTALLKFIKLDQHRMLLSSKDALCSHITLRNSLHNSYSATTSAIVFCWMLHAAHYMLLCDAILA